MKRMIGMLFTVCILFAFTNIVFAAEIDEIDWTRKGSISLNIKDPETNDAVEGGEFTVFHVADLVKNGDSVSYSYTEAFKNCTLPLDDIDISSLAVQLEDFVLTNELSGEKCAVESSGRISVKDLSLGLYLIVQTKDFDGYYTVNSFVVSVPMVLSDSMVYDIDATSKMELIPLGDNPLITPSPTPGVKKTPTPSKPSTPTDKLTQTGQLNWPVPILIITGLLLFAYGWVKTYSPKGSV